MDKNSTNGIRPYIVNGVITHFSEYGDRHYIMIRAADGRMVELAVSNPVLTD